MDSFQSTYQHLRHLFPEIDVRIIKATALEHAGDIDAALEFLYDEAVSCTNKPVKSEEKHATNSTLQIVDVPESSGDIRKNSSWCSDKQNASLPSENNENVATDITLKPLALEPSNDACSISSSQVSVGLIESFSQEARGVKESILNLIKEVSNLRKKADEECITAQKAKSEAETGGESLIKQADEIHEQTVQMRQDNLMRSGELYGEKAVIALEASALKLRLEQLKQQKEKAVAVLLEIRKTLQKCYESAVEERIVAELAKQMKEERARRILEEKEALLLTEQEESKKLQLEEEALAQLRESLGNHGNTIDALQGEISVLCEDVEIFKKQVSDGMWSSLSVTSTSSLLNPEGPYSFRKCSQTSSSLNSSDSSQELPLGQQPFEGSERQQEPQSLNHETYKNINLVNIDHFPCSSSYHSSASSVASSIRSNNVQPQSNCPNGVHGLNVAHAIHPQSETMAGSMKSIGDIYTDQSLKQCSILDTSSNLEFVKAFLSSDGNTNWNWIYGTGLLSSEQQDIHNGVLSLGDCNPEQTRQAVEDWILTTKQTEEMNSSSSSLVKVELTDCD